MFRITRTLCMLAVGLERVVVEVRHVVVVEVDRDRPPVPELLRRILRAVGGGRAVRIAVGLDVDAVVKIGDVVVGDDVAGAVDLDGHVRRHHRRKLLAVDAVELAPELRARPADHVIRIVAADERVVGDVEVARARVVGEDAGADILEPAALHGQPLRAGDELRARPDRDVGVPERQPFEVGVVRGLHVEQREVAVAVEDHLAVAGALDRDRLLGGAVGGQVIGAVERHGAIHRRVVRVFEAVVLVEPGVHEDRVAGLARAAGRRSPSRCRRTSGCRRTSALRTRARFSALQSPAGRRETRGRLQPASAPDASARSRSSWRLAVRRRPDPTGRTAPRTRCRARDPGCCRRTCSATMTSSERAVVDPLALQPQAAAAPRFHWRLACLRYETSTAALRLSSPSTNHSKPRLISVGGSTMNSPGRMSFRSAARTAGYQTTAGPNRRSPATKQRFTRRIADE